MRIPTVCGFQKVGSANCKFFVWFQLCCSHLSDGRIDDTWRIMWAEILSFWFWWMDRNSIWTFLNVWVECVLPSPWIGIDECCSLILSSSTVFLEMNETSEPESMSILILWDLTDESYHANTVANKVEWVDEFVSWVYPWDKMIAPMSYCWAECCPEVPWGLMSG